MFKISNPGLQCNSTNNNVELFSTNLSSLKKGNANISFLVVSIVFFFIYLLNM